MSVQTLDLAEPFFTIRLLSGEAAYRVEGKVILLNLSDDGQAGNSRCFRKAFEPLKVLAFVY